MIHNPHSTGREDTIIYYCRKCGYEEAPLSGSEMARAPKCDRCRVPLHFVKYEAATEAALAWKIIDRETKP